MEKIGQKINERTMHTDTEQAIDKLSSDAVALFYKVVPNNIVRGGHPGTPGPSSTDTNWNKEQARIDGIIETLQRLKPYL